MMRQPFLTPWKNQEAIELMSISPRKANVPKIKKTFSTSNKMIVYTSNVCSLSEQTKNLPVWFVRFHSLGGLWIGELMNQREKFRSWWINSFSLLSPPYPQCLEHTHSNASCLIVPELLGHIVRHGDHLSRKNFYHFVLYSIKVLGLVKVKCHILSLDIVLLTWQRCLSAHFLLWGNLGNLHSDWYSNRVISIATKIVQNFLQPFLFKLLSFTLSDNSQFGPNTLKASPKSK